ncbi:MAG: hypothetical protein JOZ39_11000 [Chloroflexi bacterium]|nr:hypothetical protein [Chloroflexota bacterium]
MPCPSFSILAGETCPGADFVSAASKCRVCYANPAERALAHRSVGKYGTPTVINAQQVRTQWVRRCMMTNEGVAEFVAVVTAGIRYELRNVKAQKYFRLHDSGDFWSPRYVAAWHQVIRNLPGVLFWAPTQSWSIQKPVWQRALLALAAEPNMVLSPSGTEIDGAVPNVDGYAAGSAVVTSGELCPAPTQSNKCGACRRCWDKAAIRTYRLH